MKTALLLSAALLFALPLGQSMAADDAPKGMTDAAAEIQAPAPVKSFNLDSSKTFLALTTKKSGNLSAIAHDHVVVPSKMNGTISFSADDASKNSIKLSFDVQSLVVDKPSHRERVGLPEGPDSDDQASIRENMLSPDQLDASKHKKMSFESTSITHKGGSTYTVKGKLTLRGVTKTVSFPATVKMDGGAFHGTGQLKITHAQFGFEPYSALFGQIKNSEEMLLKLDIWGK